jgi:hypothetical protein
MGAQRYRALLIGNSVFAEDAANLARLEGPQKDVTLLHHALVNEQSGMFSEESVRVLLEQPMRTMMREIHTFFADAHRDDVLMLYYSGHGLLDPQDRLYLCASDTVSTALLPTAVSNAFVGDCMAASPTRTTVIVLDCCYSGAFKGGGRVPESLAGPGRFVLSSCRGRELANAASAENGASLFTSHLVDAMLGKAADRDGDGFIDLGEVFAYVQSALRDQQQSPQKRFDGDRDLVIARSPVTPATREGSGVREDHVPERLRPVLALSETVIDLRDVSPDEVLPDERVAVYNLGEGTLDWVAQTDADWFDLVTDQEGIVLQLHPRPGQNRGKVLVRERSTGAVHSVRVTVSVRTSGGGPRPVLHVWPTEVAFGRVWEGQQAEVVLAVANTGGGELQWTHHATGDFYEVGGQGDRLVVRLRGPAGRHQGAVTITSNAGQLVVPVSVDVVPPPGAAPPPRTQPPAGTGQPQAGQLDPGAQTAQTLAIVSLVLSFVCGIGLFCVPVAITLASRADRRIKASSGALVGADRVRTARILGWIAAVISGLWWVAILVTALTDTTTTA